MGYEENESQGFGDDIKKASWNSAQLTNLRLDKIKARIEDGWLNPTAWNYELDNWNYDIIFIATNLLFKVVKPKLTPKEFKDGEAMRINIKKFLAVYPIHENKSKLYGRQKNWKLNQVNWMVLEHWLWDYGVLVGDYYDKHGMDIPTSDDDDGL